MARQRQALQQAEWNLERLKEDRKGLIEEQRSGAIRWSTDAGAGEEQVAKRQCINVDSDEEDRELVVDRKRKAQ